MSKISPTAVNVYAKAKSRYFLASLFFIYFFFGSRSENCVVCILRLNERMTIICTHMRKNDGGDKKMTTTTTYTQTIS